MKKTFLTLGFLSLLLTLAMPVLAQQDGGENPGDGGGNPINVSFKIQNPFAIGDNLFEVMEGILDNIIIPIGGMLCVLAFIWGGFQYVVAQGNPGKITTANKTLLYAAIGTAILLGAKVIQVLIQNTFTQILS